MDEKIKKFDRSIEKMMNETAVTPPFGMWNRISAGLDAEVLPIATPAPVTPLPKSGMIGFVAGALILGTTLLVAYLVNNTSMEQKHFTSDAPELIVPYIEHAEPEVIVIEETKTVPVSVSKIVTATEPIIKETVADKIPVVQNHLQNTHNEVAIPNHPLAQNTTASIDPYYFPPVDVNNVAASKDEPIAKDVDEDDDHPVATEKKLKVSSSSGHEKKLRPKKKRSGSFSYGRINRYRNPK